MYRRCILCMCICVVIIQLFRLPYVNKRIISYRMSSYTNINYLLFGAMDDSNGALFRCALLFSGRLDEGALLVVTGTSLVYANLTGTTTVGMLGAITTGTGCNGTLTTQLNG